MNLENLPTQTRKDIMNHIKKNIRKYYKGLKSHSLKYDFFVRTILTKGPAPLWLKEHPALKNDLEFRRSLIEYTKNQTQRYIQLENYHKTIDTSNHIGILHHCSTSSKTFCLSIKEKLEFKKILHHHGYTLSIPVEFITPTESRYIKSYIQNGHSIPYEWEKVLNYIKKST